MINRFSFIHVVLLFIITVLFNITYVIPRFSYPLTHIKNPPLKEYAVMDLAGYLVGARRLVADLSWIQTLLYYGSPENRASDEQQYRKTLSYFKRLLHPHKSTGDENAHKAGHKHEHAEGESHGSFEGGKYYELITYSYRTAYLDPFFDYGYLYSAGSLAWNLNRSEEAVELLKYGLKVMEPLKSYYPKDNFAPYWRFNLYLSAIAFKKGGHIKEMTELLEKAVKLPNAPNMIKTILANIYEKNGNYIGSLKLWLDIYDSGDKSMLGRAKTKIEELRRLLHI
jgi:tetratricopeptide (TPR) repeat protein